MVVPSPGIDVQLVRWPTERHRRDRLRRDGQPRLLLIEGDAAPPSAGDCLEDWVRLPVDDRDLSLRQRGLMARARSHLIAPPVLDRDGVLRVGEAWVSLPPVEARLTDALLERKDAVVSREGLARAGWPEAAPGRNALDVHMLRLRRRLAPVGLVIRTVRSRGYLLEAASDSRQEPVKEA